MSRFAQLADEFQRMLADAARHGDIAERKAAIVSARRLLQQLMATGNIAIEGLEKKPDERSPVRFPYKDE